MKLSEDDLLARMDWLIGAAPGEDEPILLFGECDGCMCPLGRPPCHHCVEHIDLDGETVLCDLQ